MAKTVRNVDEERMEHCRDDMDTLLVFAGLFSAVMTAFVGQSYQTLQPDQSAVMVELLRKISMSPRSGCYASTIYTDPPLSPLQNLVDVAAPAEPSITAVRVNVLWFSSLALSLVTTSFAILVKQWLHEYLAVDPQYTSPLMRLRIRHFRYPGLTVWRVFEIAAILPLLLQLALGLFLVGLCFFTWTVHAKVGTATVVIVSGWALLIVLSTLAPVLHPRCPFKTTLLLRLIVLMRQLLYDVWGRHRRSEADAAVDSARDLDVIAGLDDIVQDDDFLGTIIHGALQQMTLRPEQVISFVLHILRSRLGTPVELRNMRNTYRVQLLPDFRQLGKRGWDAVVDIVSDLIMKHGELELQPRGDAWPSWMQDAITILLADSNHPLTPSGNRVLSRCLMWVKARNHTAQVIAVFASDKDQSHSLALSQVFRRLRSPLQAMAPMYMFSTVLSIAQHTICKDHDHNDDRLVGFIQRHRDLSSVTRHAIIELLVDCTSRVLSSPGEGHNGADWATGPKHAFDALLCCDVPIEARGQVNRLLIALMRREKHIHEALLPVIASHESDRASWKPEDVLRIFVRAFGSADIHEHRAILNNMVRICTSREIGSGDPELQPETRTAPLNPVRLCRLAIRMLVPAETGDLSRNLQWLWEHMSSAIRKFRLEGQYDVEEQATLATDCLSSLGHTDSFNSGKLYIGEELLRELEQLRIVAKNITMPEPRPEIPRPL